MHASDGRKWLEGTFPDPEVRRYCHIFDAIAATVSFIAPELFGAGAAGAAEAGAIGAEAAIPAAVGGAEAAGGGGFLGGLFDAGGVFGSQGPLFGTAADASIAGGGAPLSLGGADAAAGIGAAEAGGGFADLFGFGGAVPGGEFAGATGAGGGLPLAGSPLNIEPLSGAALPATSISPAPGAGGAAAALPAGIPGSPAATGAFVDTAEYGPGLLSSSFDPASGVSTASGVGSPATGGGGGITSGLDKLVGGATGGFLNTKDLGVLTAAGGLGMNLLNRNQPIPGEKQVNQAASGLTATAGAQANKGMQLESFVNSGTLPPGLADGLKTATAAAEASIKSAHAKSGTTGSSAEAQDIQAAHERAQTAAAQIALQLLQQGSSMVGQAVNTEALAAGLYREIMASALSQDEALGKAIGNFAGALAGGSNRGNTFTITGGTAA